MSDEVRTADSSGAIVEAPSNITVTLSGSGIGFFSDSNCSQPLASDQVTINAGDTGAHFFFLAESGGDTFAITGTPSGALSAASQNLTYANVDDWIGGASCTGVWTDNNCWSQGGAPNTYAGTAIFSNSLCSTNCNATINSSGTVANNIVLESDYTGTVTQGAGYSSGTGSTLEVLGGTFKGSSSSADTFSAGAGTATGRYGVFLDGTGTLNLQAATLLVGVCYACSGAFVNDGGTFTAGTGTVELQPGGSHLIVGSSTFYNLTMDNSSSAAGFIVFQAGATQTVTNALTLIGGSNYLYLNSSTPGTQWNLVPPSGTTLGGNLQVQDSNSSVTIHSGANSTDSGNNTNWSFP